MEDKIMEIAIKHSAIAAMKLLVMDTEEEQKAYMEGFKDVMNMMTEVGEKVEAEKEKSFHNPAFDDLINAFLFDDEEEKN